MTLTQLTLLKTLIATGGNLVNLRSTIPAKHPELNQAILQATEFLNGDQHVKFNERVYCIINGLTARPTNGRGEPAQFVNYFEGYSLCERTGRVMEKQRVLAESKSKSESSRASVKAAHLAEARRIMTNIGSTSEELGEKIREINAVYKRKNPQLWADDKVAGRDYIECPLTGTRKTFITEAYIRGLGLTREEYFVLCGGEFDLTSDIRRETLKEALKQIDPETGLTIHQKVIKAARVTLSSVDPETGLTRDQMRAKKVKAAHMANVDETGRNGYSQLASKAIIKGNQTKRERGLILMEEDQPAFNVYSTLVRKMTPPLRKHFSHYDFTRESDDSPELDHRYSVVAGFRDRVSPQVIGHLKNHEVITRLENITKHGKCSVELDDLLTECGYTPERNKLEGEMFRSVIEETLGQGMTPSEVWDLYIQRLNQAGTENN